MVPKQRYMEVNLLNQDGAGEGEGEAEGGGVRDQAYLNDWFGLIEGSLRW